MANHVISTPLNGNDRVTVLHFSAKIKQNKKQFKPAFMSRSARQATKEKKRKRQRCQRPQNECPFPPEVINPQRPCLMPKSQFPLPKSAQLANPRLSHHLLLGPLHGFNCDQKARSRMPNTLKQKVSPATPHQRTGKAAASNTINRIRNLHALLGSLLTLK